MPREGGDLGLDRKRRKIERASALAHPWKTAREESVAQGPARAEQAEPAHIDEARRLFVRARCAGGECRRIDPDQSVAASPSRRAGQ
jgi:hypothetical protein